MADIAATVVRHRLWFAAGFLVIASLLLPLSPQTTEKLEIGGAGVNRSEAAKVDSLLESQFVAPFSNNLVLALTGIPSLEETDGLDVLMEVIEEVARLDIVIGVLSYLDTVDPTFFNEDSTFIVVGLSRGERRSEETVLELRRLTQLLETRLRPAHPLIELSWTGAAAFDYDVRLTSSQDAAQAEVRVLPVVLVLLFIVFGSVASALCPVVVGGLGVGLSLGAAVLISSFWPMTVLLQNIVSMVGLGIGIDYTLLMLSRFREEMSANPDAERAATHTLHSAGHTVILSGSAVAIGFAALLVVPATELRSIATGGLLVVGFSILLATVILPGIFAWLGARIEAGRLWKPRVASELPRQWLAWGHWVTAHPVRILVIAGLPLAVLAWQARQISTDIPSGNWLPERMESTRGALALQRIGQSGIVQTMRVLVEIPAEHAADTEEGWDAVLKLSRKFESDHRVARVLTLQYVLGLETASAREAKSAIVEPELRAAYVSQDGRLALIQIIPHENASAGALMDYVRELREMDAAAVSGLANVRILIGGLPALNADYQDAIGGSVREIVVFIVVASFVALLVGFRSLLGAFKAVALNLLSVAAAMGVTVLVFQQGYGSEWLGVAQPLDGLFPAVPIIVFCVVFGLSMDYEVFLLSRVLEGVRKGLSNHDALIDGLARTGGVITSAALVMIVVFAGFSMGDFLIIKILGFSAAVAVFFDATLVRLAIGPALMELGGRWNWWPGIR